MLNKHSRAVALKSGHQRFFMLMLLSLLTFAVIYVAMPHLAFAQVGDPGNLDPNPGHSEIPHDNAPGALANGVIKNVGNNAVKIPVVAAMLAYVIGTVLTAIGLLKLRAWIADSDRNTLNAALFRILVGAVLIALPHTFVVINNTFFGSTATNNGSNVFISPPKMTVFTKSNRT